MCILSQCRFRTKLTHMHEDSSSVNTTNNDITHAIAKQCCVALC